ncbi:MAG: hypothetical protein ACHQFW_02470 [Chitinophagales bacterium]
MKKFLSKILLFLTPLLIAVVVIFILPYNRKFAYCYIKGSCYNRGEWVYNRIFESETPIDIAFIGTSHTMNTVNDEIVEDSLNLKFNKQIHIANLSYCWEGLNTHYLILKDLVENKSPSTIVFEVREHEHKTDHTVFSFLAGTDDVFEQPFLKNSDCFLNVYDAVISRFVQFTSEDKYIPHGNTIKDHGYGYGLEIADTNELKEQSRLQERKYGEDGFLLDYTMTPYSRFYFNKMMEICKEKNIHVYFLYLPAYGDVMGKPLDYELYKQYGEVLLPPQEKLRKQTFWLDRSHLNRDGGTFVTEWLIEQLLSSQEHLE